MSQHLEDRLPLQGDLIAPEELHFLAGVITHRKRCGSTGLTFSNICANEVA